MQTSKQTKRSVGDSDRFERMTKHMSETSRKQKPPADLSQGRSHLKHSGHLSESLSKSPSCTNEYYGRSPRFCATKLIITLRIRVIPRSSKEGPLCKHSKAHALGTRMDNRAIMNFDRVPSNFGLTQSLPSRFMNLPPSINCALPSNLSTIRDRASRAPSKSRRRSGTLSPPSALAFRPESGVSHFPSPVTLFLTNSVPCFLSSALPRLLRTSLHRLILQHLSDLAPFKVVSGFRSSRLLLKPLLLSGPAPSKAVSGSLFNSTLSALIPQVITMSGQQGQPSNQAKNKDPLGNIFNNKECNMCMAHTIMINSLKAQVKELTEDYHADRNSKRKKLEKRKREIEDLKDRCIHMEAVIDHLRTLTESQQAETSTRASARKEDSVTQHLP